MSELKEVKFHEMNAIKLGLRNDKLYFKSEVDKVIADKDKEIEELRNEADVYKAKYEQEYDIAVHNEKQLSAMRIEIRRQKYRRCLAMAMWCASRVVVWTTDGNERKSDLHWKWKKRWKNLADKFKEAK